MYRQHLFSAGPTAAVRLPADHGPPPGQEDRYYRWGGPKSTPNGQPQENPSGAWASCLRFRAGATEESRGLNLVLSLVIARFPTVDAIELPVLAETNPVVGVAKGTVTIAGAALLRLIAHNAAEFFVDHRLNPSSTPPIVSRARHSGASDPENQPLSLACPALQPLRRTLVSLICRTTRKPLTFPKHFQ